MALDIRGSVATGGRAAEEMIEENKFSSGGWQETFWFKLADKETGIYRFLTDADEWLSVYQHPFAPTRPAPDWMEAEAKGRWPQSMSPICRRTPQFAHFFPDGCYICDHMHEVRPAKTKTKRYYGQVRLWALAVEREEVREDGRVVGYRDVEIEGDELGEDGKPTGKKVMKKKIVVFNMAWKNFFGPLQGFADAYNGTVLDRDYMITRKGKDQSTDYNIVPLDPVQRADGSVVDMRDPEVVNGQPTGRKLRDSKLDDGPDLFKMIEDRIDDAYYHRFFDDRVPVPERGGDRKDGGDEAPSSASQASSNGSAPDEAKTATAERLARLRQRVTGDHGNGSGGDEPPAAAASAGLKNFD